MHCSPSSVPVNASQPSNPSKPPDLLIRDLSFSFGGDPVFTGVNLNIAGGLCTCILGPSGCGKSTLLRLISGQSGLNYSGEISINNGDSEPDQIAWMAQKDLLLPWKNVFDNILLGAHLRREPTKALKEKAASLINLAGLEGCETSLPETLSGGMRQRVALLRTLMEDRSVILMDEPFSALDALNRINLQNLMVKLVSNATVLMVTHDPMEALRIADQIYVFSGTPARVGEVIIPPGPKPRDISSKGVADLSSLLLGQLLEGEE